MALPAAQLTVELVPHCTSVPRDGWTASHDVRPLSELGMRQAAALVTAIGTGVDGIYSSPAARCRQTVGPLAAATGLPVHDLAELCEAGDFGEPAAGTRGVPDLIVRALGGASHDDVIPVLLAALSSAFGIPLPRHVGRGGWYTLRFVPGGLAITPHDPARA
jgi:8-oxo-dGTP diphosphatase